MLVTGAQPVIRTRMENPYNDHAMPAESTISPAVKIHFQRTMPTYMPKSKVATQKIPQTSMKGLRRL